MRPARFTDIAEFIETEEDQFARIARRFWANVSRGAPDECWPWTGFVAISGYGKMKVRQRGSGSFGVQSNRLAWMITIGPIPVGLGVLHKCDNRVCCNVEHLFLGTDGDNMRDMASKGRAHPQPDNRHNAKLTLDQVRDILAEHGTIPIGPGRRREIAQTLGVHPTSIWNVTARKTWLPEFIQEKDA